MSIEGLMDHTCTVYRPTEALNALREKVNTYASVGTASLALVPPRLERQDEGAGEALTGRLDGYMTANANVADEDVLDVTSGPESPRKLRVISRSRPRGHHTELILEMFHGVIP